MFLIGYPLLTPAPKDRIQMNQIAKFFEPGTTGMDL
jgi:hypothetical protein